MSAPDSPGSNRVTAERELLFWESVKGSRDPSDIRLYLERYSGGTYEALAHNRLKRLEGLAKSTGPSVSTPKAPSKSAREGEMRLTVEREFWALVKESEEPSDLEAYLEHYPDGVYAPLARLRLAQLSPSGGAPCVAGHRICWKRVTKRHSGTVHHCAAPTHWEPPNCFLRCSSRL